MMAPTKSKQDAGIMDPSDSKQGAVHSMWLTPLLMVYYLCCWPQHPDSDTSSDRSTGRRGVTRHESGSQRRASELFRRRVGSSAVSLHLPTTSGSKKESVCAHRSHEDIGRCGAGGAVQEDEWSAARHHSAPSVIHEVLHRRDWDRSTRDLYIPLRPPGDLPDDLSAPSPPPPPPPCKKHHTNIKSSRAKETRAAAEEKDCDETSSFYIGDNDVVSPRRLEHRAKEDKQSWNEAVRCRQPPDDVTESEARAGATHHTMESRVSLSRPPHHPPSVEAVGYEGGACYLAETGRVSALRARGGTAPAAGGGACVGVMRARHASDGDILAPRHRPESGAFSESDLELDLEGAQSPLEAVEERPPPYDELALYVTARSDRKETAI